MKLSNKESQDNYIINNLSLINEQIYKLKWQNLVGNDLVFDEHGDLIGNVNHHLQWDPSTKFLDRKDVEKVKSETNDNSTNFYRTMVKVLREKQDNRSNQPRD